MQPMPDIIGHTRQREALARLVERGKLASTLMFVGREGIGKQRVARELLASLHCETNQLADDGVVAGSSFTYGGCKTCHACILLAAHNHPDAHVVECAERKVWTVDRIRELLYTLHLASFSGSYRTVLFNDAHELSVQAANILLKTLEEPRKKTHYCLVTPNPRALPSTIASRSQLWYFDELHTDQVAEILSTISSEQHEQLNEIPADELAVLLDGSLAQVDAALHHAALWREINDRLDDIAAGDAASAIEFARQCGQDKEFLNVRLGFLRIASRRRMLGAANACDQRRWAIAIANILAAERLCNRRNLNAGYLLQCAFTELAQSGDPSFTYLNSDATLLSSLEV